MLALKPLVAHVLLAITILTDSGVAVAAEPASAVAPPISITHAVSANDAPKQPRSLVRRRDTIAAAAAPALTEPFSGTTTSSDLWSFSGDTCLTAGPPPAPTPVPSPEPTVGPISTVPACGKNASVDSVGHGALELTPATTYQQGTVTYNTPFSTARGLQIVFTDYDFGGTGADGAALFLADASLAFPVPAAGAALGYDGLSGGYLGIGFDEEGDFSGANGGTVVKNTVALRGATSAGNPYLGGYTVGGVAAPLPFQLANKSATTRPAGSPTIRATILPSGEVIVEIDIHDGNGYVAYYDKQIVGGAAAQPAIPAQVYVGFSAQTGGGTDNHQIGGLSISYLTPASAAFAPTQVAHLAAWYDASDPTALAETGGLVSSATDKSGNGNDVEQSATGAMPFLGASLDGRSALQFTGKQYLTSANANFAADLLNESTVFVVGDRSPIAQSSSILSSGVFESGTATSEPLYDLQFGNGGQTDFDFNNRSTGRLAATTQSIGPALWSATGDESGHSETLSKNGLVIASGTSPAAATNNAFPLVIGANRLLRGPGLFYNGKVGEVLVYNSVLTPANKATVEGYLACKWGLQALLPASHPYLHTCPPGIVPSGTASVAHTGSANALVEPQQLVSANGLLTLTLTAKAGASGNPELTYNGSATAPTLRLLPGDVLTVNLNNALPTPPAGANYLNDTNLHFHGLHVSPNAPSDDSIDLLALPGQSLQYKIAIPVNHPPGLYWYHSHAHGEAERQNLSGMSGALVIDGISSYVPQVANMQEQILIARDTENPGNPLPDANRRQLAAMYWAMQHANTPKAKRGGALPGMRMGSSVRSMTMGDAVVVRGRTNAATRNPFVTVSNRYRTVSKKRYDTSTHCVAGTPESPDKSLTLNGATVPSINIKPGEQQFWRVVNAGSDTYLDLALDNAQMQIVAIDGVPISSGVGTPASSISAAVPDYVLPPASRVEMIVTGPPAGTQAYLRTNCFDSGPTGLAMPARVLASINPAPLLSSGANERRIPPRTRQYRFANGKRRSAIVVARTQTLSYTDQNNIDGIAYDPAAPPKYYAQSGTYEEWTIVNNSTQVHTFHIHQIHFVLEAINGVTQTEQYVEDNVNVPPANGNGPGSVKILLDFTDPRIIGTFLLHCHILSHEDEGMMAKIRIGTAPALSVAPAALSFTSPTAASQAVTVSGGTGPYSVTGCTGIATAALNANDTSATVSPSGNGSCVLSISDSTGQTANLSVNVSATAASLFVNPASVGFSTVNAAGSTVAITGGTAPYAVNASACAGIANAALDGTNPAQVDISPVAVGSCAIAVTDSASNTATISVSVNAASTANSLDNVTFHHDVGRTGWYSSEPTLTTANVASANFKLLATLTNTSVANGTTYPAFGKVYAQPLYAYQEATADGLVHNLVVIATMTDQIYAIDDTTYKVVWERNFTNPGGGITQQSYTDTNCDDVNPDIGIAATPVIDRNKDLLYAAVATKENGTAHLRLHAISLASGADKVTAVEINPTITANGVTATVSAKANFSRAALLEANGNIYVSLGSHCDQGSSSTHGWIISYTATNLAINGSGTDLTAAADSTGVFLGAIWMSGFGPAADAGGNVYLSTGNGPFNGTTNFGMSDVKLPGNLSTAQATTFTPIGAAADSNTDADLGAGGIVLLPDLGGSYPHVAIQGGKCGSGGSNGTSGCMKYLLNRDHMGGQQTGDAGALAQSNTGGGLWGGPAVYKDASGATYVVYGGGSSEGGSAPLGSYKVVTSANGPPTLSVVSTIGSTPNCLECRDHGSQPIISSNGTTAGTAIVWALKTPNNPPVSPGLPITLYAWDARAMGTPLFNATAGAWTRGSGSNYIAGALVSPVVANGKVYVPSDGEVTVFGIGQ